MKSLNKPAVFLFFLLSRREKIPENKGDSVFPVRFLVSVIRASGITFTHIRQKNPHSLWRDRAQIKHRSSLPYEAVPCPHKCGSAAKGNWLVLRGAAWPQQAPSLSLQQHTTNPLTSQDILHLYQILKAQKSPSSLWYWTEIPNISYHVSLALHIFVVN